MEQQLNISMVLDNLRSLIDTYHLGYSSMTIDQLMGCQDEIVAFRYTLAEICANTKGDYLSAVFRRKIAVGAAQRALISQKMSVAAAKIEADVNNEQKFFEELETEKIAYKSELLLKTSGRVVDAIRQRISILKHEKETT